MSTNDKRKSSLMPFLIGLVVIVVVATGVWLYLQSQQPGVSTVTSVAVNMPLTGPLSIFGVPVQRGLQMALDELIAKGTLTKQQVALGFEDNEGQQDLGLTIWNKQKEQHPDVYISGIGINTLVFNTRVNEAGIPHVIFGWPISVTKSSPNTLRLWLHYKLELQQYLKYIKSQNPKKISIVYANYAPYEELVEQYLKPAIQKMGGIEVSTEVFEPGTQEFNDIAAKVRDFDPDLIIFDALPFEFPGVVRAFRAFGLVEPGRFLGTMDFIDAPAFLSAEELEGIVFPTPRFVAEPDTPQIKDWKQRYKTKYSEDPSYTAAYAYDLMNVLSSTIKANPEAKGIDLAKLLRKVNTTGVTGKIVFDGDGDLNPDMFLLQYENGVPKKLSLP